MRLTKTQSKKRMSQSDKTTFLNFGWFNNLPQEQQSAVARANRERGLPFDTNPDNLRSEPTSSPKGSAVDTDVAAAAPGGEMGDLREQAENLAKEEAALENDIRNTQGAINANKNINQEAQHDGGKDESVLAEANDLPTQTYVNTQENDNWTTFVKENR